MPGPSRRAAPALLLALTLASLAAGAVALRSYDLGWHLRAGEWILEHRGAPPRQDVISFTGAAAAWVDHEWLFQALLAGLVRVLGPAGAWGLKQLLVLIATLVPAGWLLWRGSSPLIVATLACVALQGARFRFSERPEMAGLALLPVVLILLAEWDRGRAGRLVLALPILVALWANLHPSALLAAGLVGVWVVGSTLSSPAGAPRVALGGPCSLASASHFSPIPGGRPCCAFPSRSAPRWRARGLSIRSGGMPCGASSGSSG